MNLHRTILALWIISCPWTGTARGQFSQTGAGPYDYSNTSNWTGGIINGVFSQTLVANQTIGFSSDTTLPTGLTFATGGAFNETLEGLGGDHTLTLEGNISVNSVLGGQTVTIGSLTSGQNLNVSSPQSSIWTFNVGANDTLIFLNQVQTTFPVYKAGNGTLIFGGSSTCPVNLIEGGTLIIDCSTQTGNKMVSGGIGLTSGAFEVLGNSSAATTQSLSLYQENYGASYVSVISNGQSTVLNTGDFGGGSTTIGGTVDFELPVNGAIETSASNVNGILTGRATVGKSTWAASDGNGNLVGLTSFSNNISSGANTDLMSTQTVSSNVIASTLRFNTTSPIAVSIANGTTLTTGGILVTSNVGNNLSQITGGTLTSGLPDLVIHQYNTAASLEIDSTISTDYGLTVSGPGTVILRGANTYGFQTAINGATVNIASINNFGTGFESTIYINGGGLQLAGNITMDQSIQGGYAGATIDTNGFNFSFPGELGFGGTGGLTKIGNGTLSLVAYAEFSGPITISGGILSLGARNSTAILQGSNPIVFSGGTLQFAGDTTDYSSRIMNSGSAILIDTDGFNITFASGLAGSNTGGLTKIGAGILTLSSANAYSGNTAINGGELSLGNVAAVNTTGTISFGGGALQFTSSNTTDYSGRFSTASGQQYSFDTNGQSVTLAGNLTSVGGSLTKLGSGILTLAGTNTYAGGTAINGGELRLGSSGALSATGTISFGGGALQFTSSNTTDYSSQFSSSAGQRYSFDTNGQTVTLAGNLASSGGSLTKLGAGTLILTGTNALSNGITVGGGVLKINSESQIGVEATYNGLTLYFGGELLTNNVSGEVMARPITTSGSAAIAAVTGTQYTYYSNISGGGTLTIGDATNAGLVTMDNTISDGYFATSLTLLNGQLNLLGANTYTGGTIINGGTLVASNSSAFGLGGLTLNDGILALNTVIPTINIIYNNNFVQTGGTLLLTANDPVQGTSYNVLQVTGTATLGGTLEVNVTGYTSGETFSFVLSASAITGSFAHIVNDQSGYTTLSQALSADHKTLTITVTVSAQSFSQWEEQPGFFTSQELNNSAVSSPDATPENDGVPNLLKYLFNINPTVPMNSTDRAALPTVGIDTTTNPGTRYLTLTYRQYAYQGGITVNVQTSSDLQSWTTVKPPDLSQQIGTDPNTGDPIMEVGVVANGTNKQFIRLNVTQP